MPSAPKVNTSDASLPKKVLHILQLSYLHIMLRVKKINKFGISTPC